MIILYTFDYYPQRTVSAHYLIISICSIEQQFQGKQHRIIIYTTDVLSLTNYLSKLLRHIRIEIRHYDPTLFQTQNYHVEWSRYPAGWNTIGHARVYLIPYLLDTYHESVLYLDCDTGAIASTDLYEHLINLKTPVINAIEGEQSGQLYGEQLHFKPQVMNLKIYFYKLISTQPRQLYHLKITGQKYNVTTITKNNGILYFPSTELSMYMACETIVVYEKLMSIYPYGFNDLNAATCVFNQHPEITCQAMIPARFLSGNKPISDLTTYLDYHPIRLTHYFTISWQYYGSQSDTTGYEAIISVYKDMMIINGQVQPQVEPSLLIIGENLLETIFFPNNFSTIFHPVQDEVSVITILRREINQFTHIKTNCIILSYITFILLIQPTIWIKSSQGQVIEPNDWFDPTEQLLEINQLMSNVQLELTQQSIQPMILIDIITANQQARQFLQIAIEKYPKGMLLTKNSPNYCPSQEVIVKGIEQGDLELITKYLDQLDLNQVDQSGNTLLHLSIIHQRLEIQQLFQIRKCDINLKNGQGETPLHLAVKCNSCESVKLLLKSNATQSLMNRDGHTPLKLADQLGLKVIHDLLSMYEMKQSCTRHRRRNDTNNMLW